MQTFLPFPDFKTSAMSLDDLRLRKQLIEVNQILGVLEGKTDAWKNHPAVLMWKGYLGSLIHYRNVVLEENHNRGFMSLHTHREVDGRYTLPAWWNVSELHNSHKSKLLWKGRVDSVCARLKSHYKVRSINKWLESNNLSEKNVLTRDEVVTLEKLATDLNLPSVGNHYYYFGFMVRDDSPYFWPTKNGY